MEMFFYFNRSVLIIKIQERERNLGVLVEESGQGLKIK
jgi:hypothetical protein